MKRLIWKHFHNRSGEIWRDEINVLHALKFDFVHMDPPSNSFLLRFLVIDKLRLCLLANWNRTVLPPGCRMDLSAVQKSIFAGFIKSDVCAFLANAHAGNLFFWYDFTGILDVFQAIWVHLLRNVDYKYCRLPWQFPAADVPGKIWKGLKLSHYCVGRHLGNARRKACQNFRRNTPFNLSSSNFNGFIP